MEETLDPSEMELSLDLAIAMEEEEEEELNISPATTPRIEPVSTPRDHTFPGENILEEIDEDADVDEVFGTDPKGKQILRAAKFDRIVKWIAFEDTDDSELEAFFVSYQMVSTSREMFDTFIKIHTEFIEDNEYDNNEINKKAERFIFQLVASGTVDQDILPSISSFSSKNFSSSSISELKMRLMKYKHSVSLSESPMLSALNAPSIYKSISQLYNIPNDRISSYPEDGILNFTSSHMAENLTLLESSLLSSIVREEYFNHTKPLKSPNITHFAQHFNMVSSWVAAEIFSTEPIRQVPVLKKFINLCVKLLELNNFNGSMEILCGLNSSSLQRYKKIWESLPARYTEILKQVEQTLSPLRNFRNYRNSLAACMRAGQPVVPYLAGHLKDLIFADEGNTTRNGLTSFEKLSMVGKIISQLLKAGQVPFPFQPREELLKFFTNLWWLDSDELRSCSYYHDPRRLITKSFDPEEQEQEEKKEKFVQSIFALSSAKQRSGYLPGFTKEVHNNLYDIAKLLFSKNEELQHKSRIWRGVVYRDCFSGYEAVECMINIGLCDNRRAAVEIGSRLLKENYFKSLGKYTTFLDKYGAWYQFAIEDAPGFEECQLREAQKITEIQERTDRCILIAISSTTGGIQPKIFWCGMVSINCFAGADLVAWLSDNMKIPRGEALELCARLFSRNFLTPVTITHSITTNDSFKDSKTLFYQFALQRPKQIQKQKETQFLEKDEMRTRKRMRKKLKSTSLLEELSIPAEELQIIMLMLDTFGGVPQEGSTKAWTGHNVVQWLRTQMNTTETEAAKFALSLFERKILIPLSDKDKKSTHMKTNSLFYMSPSALIVCEQQKQRQGTTVSTSTARRATISASSGPILYERANESRKLNEGLTSPNTEITADPVSVESHNLLSLLLELCDPYNGIKRSDVRYNNQTRKLFSGKKFLTWLQTNKSLSEGAALETFKNFASRGFLVTLHDSYPHTYDELGMYRFFIEKGDGTIRHKNSEVSQEKPTESIATSTQEDNIPLNRSSDDFASVQALLQSRMGGIENPNSPVRRAKPKGRSKKKTKERKMNRRTLEISRVPDQHQTPYTAPKPAILDRLDSTDSLLNLKVSSESNLVPKDVTRVKEQYDNENLQSEDSSEVSTDNEPDDSFSTCNEDFDDSIAKEDNSNEFCENSIRKEEFNVPEVSGAVEGTEVSNNTPIIEDHIAPDDEGNNTEIETKNISDDLAASNLHAEGKRVDSELTDDSFDIIDDDIDNPDHGIEAFGDSQTDCSESSYETCSEGETEVTEVTEFPEEKFIENILFDNENKEPITIQRPFMESLPEPSTKRLDIDGNDNKLSENINEPSVVPKELEEPKKQEPEEIVEEQIVIVPETQPQASNDVIEDKTDEENIIKQEEEPKKTPTPAIVLEGDGETATDNDELQRAVTYNDEISVTESELEDSQEIRTRDNSSGRKNKLRNGRTRSRDRLGKFLSSTPVSRTNSDSTFASITPNVINQADAHMMWINMLNPETGIQLKTHKGKKKSYHKSFSGTEACTWLNEYIEDNEDLRDADPVLIAQDLLSWGYIEPMNSKNKTVFEAGNINFYLLKTKDAFDAAQAKKAKKRKRFM